MKRRGIAARGSAWVLLAICLAANVLFQRLNSPQWTDVGDLQTPPRFELVRAASLGESALAGYLADLFLQNFNVSLGRATPVAAMDRSVVIRWLDLSTGLDADSRYPYLLAARHFAETGTPEQRRCMLDWIYQRFQEQPNERWPWLVHALFAARHVLHDDTLAETYAAALRTRVTDPTAPSWVTTNGCAAARRSRRDRRGEGPPGRTHRCRSNSLPRRTQVPGVANCGSAASATQNVTQSTLRVRVFCR